VTIPQMQAMLLQAPGQALRLESLPVPEPGPGQVLLRVLACGVCRTDLHIVDGDLTDGRFPLIPGHEIVGEVVAHGGDVTAGRCGLELGARVGVPWLAHTCGYCGYCLEGKENLCDEPQFTGYTVPGGYAQYTVADAAYCFPLADALDSVSAAPLLCAGLIGYRTYRLAGLARASRSARVGIYGFGAAAHLVVPVAREDGHEVYAVTRPGDRDAQDFARKCGAKWAGGADQPLPTLLDAALIFAPVGELVPQALRNLRKGGTVVCGGIHMSQIPAFPYANLWQERSIRSVANLTRADGEEFLARAGEIGIQPATRTYKLQAANEALDDLRAGRFTGAAVLVP
jgi:propanol-preferring alcohol dehydrogenase